MLRAIPTTLGVLVVSAGAATTALAVSGDAPAPDDTSIGLPAAEGPVADHAQGDTGGWPYDDTDLRTEQHERSISVQREGTSLTVVDVDAALGWTPSMERSSGYEVEVTLRRAGQRIDFWAEIEHDRVKTRVRER